MTMTSETTASSPTSIDLPANSQGAYSRPPGLFAAPHLWLFYVIGCLGIGIDAYMASSVMGVAFDLPEVANLALTFGLGIIAAKSASEAAASFNQGKRAGGIVLLGAVAAVGIALALMRTYGEAVASSAGPGEFARGGVEQASEWPATILMLALYFASATAVFLTALKLFVQERVDLRRHRRNKNEALKRLIELEAEYAVIHERIAYRDDHREIMDELLDQALDQLEAREAYLKAYARDVIARAVGRPDATPLVRAPHEPAQSGSSVDQ